VAVYYIAISGCAVTYRNAHFICQVNDLTMIILAARLGRKPGSAEQLAAFRQQFLTIPSSAVG
jgi:hypothetical protein